MLVRDALERRVRLGNAREIGQVVNATVTPPQIAVQARSPDNPAANELTIIND